MTWRQLALSAALVTALPTTVLTQNLAADLQRAMQREATSGDCKLVLAEYARIAEQGAKDSRAAAAEALLRAAICHERLADGLAQASYARVTIEFADQREISAEARQRAAAIASSGPAASRGNVGAPPRNESASGPFARTIDDRPGTLSPDGTRFLIMEGGLHEVDALTLRRRLLVEGTPREAPPSVGRIWGPGAWSLDGRDVAYVWRQATVDELRVVTVDTGKVRTIAPLPESPLIRGWTRDAVVCSSGDDVFLVKVSDGGVRKLFSLARSYDTSYDRRSQIGNVTPDGTAIVAVNAEHLALFDLATGEERVLSGGIAPEYPAVSRDGRLVAFAARPGRSWGLYVAPLDRAPFRDPVRVATLDYPGRGPLNNAVTRWLPGDVLTFTYINYWNHVYRLNVGPEGRASEAPMQLTRELDLWNASPVEISPDSRSIAFIPGSEAIDQGGIGLIAVDGSSERRRLVDRGFLLFHGWRSGDEVVFSEINGSPMKVARIEAGVVRELGALGTLKEGIRDRARYVAGTHEILFTGADRSGIEAFDIDTGKSHVVVPARGKIFTWRASPDGRQVAYWTSAGATSGRDELRVVASDGTGDKLLLAVPGGRATQEPLAWSPDLKRLLYQASELRVLALDTGQSELLLTKPFSAFLPPGVRFQFGKGSWAGDGSFVALAVGTDERPHLAWDGVSYDAVKKLMVKGGGR